MIASTHDIKQLWCKHCSKTTRHEAGSNDHPVALAFGLGFFTCGLAWLLIPVSLAMGREYVCAECGMKRRK
jgi:dipeptide/tripeptide permease